MQTYTAFINHDPQPLIQLLQQFFTSRDIRAVKDSNESALQGIIKVFWSEGRCISELHLIVDPTKQYGDGLFGFIDLLLPRSPELPMTLANVIELKNIMLTSVGMAYAKNPAKLPPIKTLESL